MKSLLIEVEGKEPFKVKITKDKISIGRREDNDIVIEDVFVSRYHAEIEKRNDAYYIIDLESTYGTFVNDKKVSFIRLKHGDRIRIGNTYITYLEEDKFEGIKGNIVEFSLDGEDNLNRIIELLKKGNTEQTIAELKKWYKNVMKSKRTMETMYEIARIISSTYDMDHLLNLSLDLALKLLGVERGFIAFVKDKHLEVKVARMMGRDVMDDLMISRGIMERVVKQKRGLLVSNAMRDPDFRDFKSVQMYRLKSIIAVPLLSRSGDVCGVIYIDDINSKMRKTFSMDDLEFMETFANHVSLAMENLRLYEKIREEEKMRDYLSRYLPPSLVEYMLTSKKTMEEIEKKKEITVMFADIRGFTDISNILSPEDVVALLNRFFSHITEIIFKYEGMIDKFLGDGVMALFGVPVSHKDHPLRAVKTGIEILEFTSHFKMDLKKEDKYKDIADMFDVGIGFDTGTVILGNVGSKRRMDFTAMGRTVNLASRLCDMAGHGEMILSERVYKLTQSMGYRYYKKSGISIKGFPEKMEIYYIEP